MTFVNITNKKPYLSIITPARNDDYIIGGMERLQFTLDILSKQVEEYKVETEIILIDYNPLSSDKTLKNSLEFPEYSEYLTIRIIEVPPEFHNRLNNSDICPFHGAVATNVGFVRARGEFLVLRNSDIIWSKELWELISGRELNPGSKYRCTRFDVSSDVLNKNEQDLEQIYLLLADHTTSKMVNMPYYVKGLPNILVNSNGDFQLMSSHNMKRLRGYEESDIINAPHCDGYLEFCSYVSGIKDVLLDNIKIYKIEHGGSYKHRVLESIFPFYGKIRKFIPPNLLGHAFIKFCRKCGLTRLLYDNRVHYKSGIKQPTRKDYYDKCKAIVNKETDYVLNDRDWGLNKIDLDEYLVITAKWDKKE